MSRRPGLAADYYNKFSKDIFPSDDIALRGKLVKPPKFYLNKLEQSDEKAFKKVKKARKKQQQKKAQDNTAERLAVKETVKKAQIKSLTRELDKEQLNNENIRIRDI